MQRAAEALREPMINAYGPCGGMPALVAALKQKLAAENGLTGVRRINTTSAVSQDHMRPATIARAEAASYQGAALAAP